MCTNKSGDLCREMYLLGNKYTDKVKLSVFLMLFGAVIAAADDLAFNFMGYCWYMSLVLQIAVSSVYIPVILWDTAGRLHWCCTLLLLLHCDVK